MKALTVEEIMDVIEKTIEIYNSEYDALKAKFEELINNN
jgi:hypothetical protein